MAGKWILAGAALGLLGAAMTPNRTRYYYCDGRYYTHKGGTVVATQTNVKCKCGAMMVLITPKTVYGGNGRCNMCFKTINKYVMCYHCPMGKNASHPKGFDYCQPCINSYQLKMSQQQQPKVVYVQSQNQAQTIYVQQQQPQQKVVYVANTQQQQKPSISPANSNPGYPGFKAKNSNSGYPASNPRTRAVSSKVSYTVASNNNNNIRYRSQSQMNNTNIKNNNNIKKTGLQDRWIFEGYMSKQGEWFKTWKLRYFKLGSDLVLWYYEKKNQGYKGKINLNKLKAIIKKKNTGFDIKLTDSNRVWCFLCNSQTDRDNWYNIIASNTINKQKIQTIPQDNVIPQQQVYTYNNVNNNNNNNNYNSNNTNNNNNNVMSYQPGYNNNNNNSNNMNMNNPSTYQASTYNNNNNNNNMNYNNYNYNANTNINNGESKEQEPGNEPGNEPGSQPGSQPGNAINQPGSINHNNNSWESNNNPPPPAFALPSAPPED